MVKFESKVELSGLIVLFVGIILLIFTFAMAYLFLTGELSIAASSDLLQSFGSAFAPLIEAIIHVLFLGIMGWIGSIVTIRSVQLLKQDKTQTQQSQAQTQQPAKVETKQTAQPSVPAPSAQTSETKTDETKKAETKPAAASDEAKK